MAQLPNIQQQGNLQMSLWQTRVKSLLDPLLSNKLTRGTLLQGVTISPGSNTINHTLSRTPVGWYLVDSNGPSVVWRTSWSTTTLILTSSATAAITSSLWVF